MKKLIILLIVLLCIPAAFAQSGSIKLLAVSDTGNSTIGSVVDMQLEIKEGSGRVFIDSFPLTKVDTQITTRTAKQIACYYAGTDCGSYDFFYTINSSSVIVGGPSAGAATTALTVAVLEGLDMNSSVAVTGTINTGNLVGTVGGIKQKIAAASENGIRIVLIPEGSSALKEGNSTISMIEYGKGLGIEVVQVSNLDDVIHYVTGTEKREPERNYSISQQYLSTMKWIAEQLCNQSTQVIADVLHESFQEGNVLDNSSAEIEREAQGLTEKAARAIKNSYYYSTASYCYGALLRNMQVKFIEQGLTFSQMQKNADELLKSIDDYEKTADGWKIQTITDLETYMIVKERIYEARKNLAAFNEDAAANDTDSAALDLASATTRFDSAKSWSRFYGKGGLQISIDKQALKDSCMQKLSEAEESLQYVEFYFPGLMNAIKSDTDEALSNYKSGNYAMCLFLATKAKSDIDSVASSIGEEDIDLLIDQRLRAAKDIIAEQNAKGIFPILGYSYYEYSLDLMGGNETGTKANALIYAGYAIELSKLDVYFKKQHSEFRIDAKKLYYLLLFLIGFVAGVFVYDVIIKSRNKAGRGHKKKK